MWVAKQDYYENANPTMSDAEFDILEAEVDSWEVKHRARFLHSPTQQVGFSKEDMVSFFKAYGYKGIEEDDIVEASLESTTVKHRTPMLSLDKIHTEEEAYAWERRIRKELGYD